MIKITITSSDMLIKDAVDLASEITRLCKHAHQVEIKDLNVNDGLKITRSIVNVAADETFKSHNK
jgi:hypothetical protein